MRHLIRFVVASSVLAACHHDAPFAPVDVIALNGRYDVTLERSLVSPNPNVTCPSFELNLIGPNSWTPTSTCGGFTGGVAAYLTQDNALVLVLEAGAPNGGTGGFYSIVLSDAAQRGGEVHSRWTSNFSCPIGSTQTCVPESGTADWTAR